MKRTLLVLLIALSLVLSTHLVLAQQDTVTVTVTYSEEAADSSDFSLKEKYRYLTRAIVEEKSMFKIGLSEVGWDRDAGPIVEYELAYERKIGIPFSLLARVQRRTVFWGASRIGADFAFRYYYALPRRIKRGKSANNLSANYFSLQNSNSWRMFATITPDPTLPLGYTFDSYVDRVSRVSLLYGLQRRIGKRGYIDVNVGYFYDFGFRNDPTRIDWGFNIEGHFSMGIAF